MEVEDAPLPAHALPPILRRWFTALLVALGVLWPAATLTAELVTRLSAKYYTDPLPTPLHILLVALVPMLDALVLYGIHSESMRLRTMRRLLGVSLGISACYAALYVPLMPVAVIGSVVGVGLLPMGPFASLLCAALLWRVLHLHAERFEHRDQERPRRWWTLQGVATGVLLLCTANAPLHLTSLGLATFHGGDEERGRTALGLVSDALIYQVMTQGSLVIPDPIGMAQAVLDIDRAYLSGDEEMFWRVTGRTFNEVHADGSVRHPPQLQRGWSFDPEAEDYLPVQEQLKLGVSRMDGSIDAEAATSYTEWTLELHNTAGFQSEGKMLLQLPEDAVVSRLTLWVHGEPEEAAFGPRGRVKAAYDSVVRRRRDPVLVTTAGSGRIAVRAFPVPPDGVMKFRIGITAPLDIRGEEEQAELLLPRILNADFVLDDALQHDVWYESFRDLEGSVDTLHTRERDERGSITRTLRGRVTAAALADGVTITATRAVGHDKVFSRDGDGVVTTRIERVVPERPERVVLVVDGSAKMSEHLPLVQEAFRQAGVTPEHVLLAGDEVRALDFDEMHRAPALGGQDNAPALLQAMRRTEGDPSAGIVWVHTAQPYTIDDRALGALKPREHRRSTTPMIYELNVEERMDVLVDQLEPEAMLTPITRRASPAQDLAEWLMHAEVGRWRAVHTRGPGEARELAHRKETSRHTARLWAREEAMRLARDGQLTAAQELAIRYQLVVPMTGAVVLETQAQYDEHGLRQVEPSTVPSIPEPEEWALIFVAMGVILYTWRRRQAQPDDEWALA
ncbi:MAG: VIT domain-containing protein [Myxococcota bacterium]